MRAVVNALFRSLYLRLRFAFPAVLMSIRLMGKKIVIIHVQETGLQEHINPVIEWLLAHSAYICVIVVRQTQLSGYRINSALPFKKSHNVVLVSEECFAHVFCTPSLVLSIHPETISGVARRFSKLGIHRIVMHHGLADKYVNIGEEDSLAYYSGFFLFGPASREGSLKSYAERYPDTFKRLKFFNIGCPKTDALINHFVDRERFVSEMGLDPSKKVVCYAPTYQRTASLEQCGIDVMHALAQLPVNVIVKLHHVSLKASRNEFEQWFIDEIGSKNWRKMIAELERKHSNIRLATGQNANPYLQISDVLVSDVSGVAYEYLLLDRPIVFFDVPDFFAQYGKQGLHYWGRECGDIVSSPDELFRSVKYVLDNPAHRRSERKKITDKIVYNKGCATETAGKTIMDLISETEPYGKKV
jgi:hypothetical protein